MDPRCTRILCANCDICVNTLRRYRVLDQNTRVVTMPCNWIYPRIVTDEDYICEECRLLMASVNQNLLQNTDSERQGTSSQRGHTNVCILCGCSLARRQSDKILRDNPTQLQQTMIEIIKNRREPQQVTPTDKVCHVCWLRIKREALRINRIDGNRSLDIVAQQGANNDSENIMSRPDMNQSHADAQEDAHEDIVRPSQAMRTESGTLLLPNYRRAANTSNHCVFSDCVNIGRLHQGLGTVRKIPVL